MTLPIVKHGSKERATVTLALEVGVDDDLINAVNQIKKEKRQSSLKNAIRGGIAYLTPVDVDQSELLLAMAQKVTELEEHIRNLHPYLEGKFSQIGTRVVSPFAAPEPTTDTASEESLQKRAARAKNAGWK